MKSSTAAMILSLAVILAIASLNFRSVEGLSCGEVISDLSPCLGYVTGPAPNPSPACCAGAHTLFDETRTTDDRRTACSCIKVAAMNFPNINGAKITQLPGKCGINLSFPISKNTDCSRIP